MSDACGKLITQLHVFVARMSTQTRFLFVALRIVAFALKGKELPELNAVSIIPRRVKKRSPFFMMENVCVMRAA